MKRGMLLAVLVGLALCAPAQAARPKLSHHAAKVAAHVWVLDAFHYAPTVTKVTRLRRLSRSTFRSYVMAGWPNGKGESDDGFWTWTFVRVRRHRDGHVYAHCAYCARDYLVGW